MKPIIFRFRDEATLPIREDYYKASYIVSYGRIQNNPNEQCNLLTLYCTERGACCTLKDPTQNSKPIIDTYIEAMDAVLNETAIGLLTM